MNFREFHTTSRPQGPPVRELVEERRCKLLYLSPYSPDQNPIEEAFSKITDMLRNVGAKSPKALVEAMGRHSMRSAPGTRRVSSRTVVTLR